MSEDLLEFEFLRFSPPSDPMEAQDDLLNALLPFVDDSNQLNMNLTSDYWLGSWMAGLDFNPGWLPVFSRAALWLRDWPDKDRGFLEAALSVVVAELMHYSPAIAVPYVANLLQDDDLRPQGLLTVSSYATAGLYPLPSEILRCLMSLGARLGSLSDLESEHLVLTLNKVGSQATEALLGEIARTIPTDFVRTRSALQAQGAGS